jgi:lytic murein transglycosylase
MARRLACALMLAVLLPPVAEAATLSACVERLRATVVNAGVPARLATEALAGVAFDEKVVRFSRTQPEHVTPIWDYMAFLVDPERIATGREMLAKHDETLRAVEKTYGVDRFVVAAVWGIESDYGKSKSEFFLPHGLANVICAGKNPAFFTGELVAALKIVAAGDIRLADLRGSWAGAFGQTQFIPSTYRRLAVDFDKDGRRDLVRSVPDALASAANYLKRAGWRRGEAWGFEVVLPRGYKGPQGRRNRAPLDAWAGQGLKRADGSPLAGKARAGLLLPAGRGGPAFLVFANFDVIFSYNMAESYALAISHLSDRLKGRGPIRTAWPTDDPGLTRAERLALQKLLIKAGYDIGEADGKIGPVTVTAIKAAERKLGLPVTGRPGRRIYQALGGT